MILKKLLTTVFILFLVPSLGADEEVELDQKITGKISADALMSVSPEDGMVVDTVAWRKLWGAWRPTQAMPDVDFQKQIVLVETVSGPNNMFVNQLMLSREGELKFDVASTRIAGPGFAYLIMIVPKSGILKINGKPVPQSATTPAGKPGTATESVLVEITGRVKTGVITIGAETTGAMIAADGIVMELDLQNDEQLIEAAQQVGNSLAQVKGRLKRVSGVEVSDRWIVKVESLVLIENLPDQPAENSAPSPRITITRPRSTVQPESEIPAMKQSFQSISVATTGGLIGANQMQTLDADGHVILEINSQLADKWDLDAVTMSQLHYFVANTDWRTVPRNTRTPNVADVFNYTITVETPKGMTRIFIDGPAVANQPVIKQLLNYLRKPKSQPSR